MSLSSARTRALAGAVVATAMIAAGLLVSPSTTLGAVDSLTADPLLFGLVVAGLYLVRPLLAWPTTPLAAVVGYGFGAAVGLPIALLGVVVTVLPVFVAARWLSADDAAASETTPHTRGTPSESEGERDSSRLLERAGDAVARYYETAGPLRGVTASRLAPIPSDIATCAAAVSGVSLRRFVVGTVIGELPWTAAAVVVGASAATVTSSGVGELGVAFSLVCAAAALVLLAGPAYGTVRRERRPEPDETENAGRSADS
ncbi:TVP38/TMEM64 family protein [Natrinema sp. CBA1119]|uniref:TVP38/TMEM64 family protein n=1 Tax=Natrinema sp. CBA1119 TaxID=1608465 RepID=UPI000BF31203|nr:VTT domain-containing protein [Natrinema sp. CBA1119]PGF18352.1 TVP38/TMEM64 family protein [Natrinema sp. CBA1119]